MKPSNFSSSGFRRPAMSRYSSRRPSAGQTSKITPIMVPPLAGELLRHADKLLELPVRRAAGDRLAREPDAVIDGGRNIRRVQPHTGVERHDRTRRAAGV